MPTFYSGIYDEAFAVRSVCGIFDVSHMARLEFPPSAASFLQKLLTCDVAAIRNGSGSYALILNDAAGILDDVIIYRKSSGDFLLVANASNRAKISAHISALGGSASDITDPTAMIAVQGPDSENAMTKIFTSGGAPDVIRDLAYFSICDVFASASEPIVICRTGYTGEDGFEVIAPAAMAERIWSRLVDDSGAVPCGLGARDVLRIEAGYNLYGADMDEGSSPYDAGLRFAVAPGVDFLGASALKSRAVRRCLAGLDAGDLPSVILRHGYPVFAGDEKVGEVTSGVYSKYLKRSIAFASIEVSTPKTAALSVDARGKRVPVARVSRRFVDGRVKAR